MRNLLSPKHLSVAGFLVASSAYAEGIALGNPLAGGDLGAIFVLPLLGSAALLLSMAIAEDLRKSLFRALLICACFVGMLIFVGIAGMSNGIAVLWLIALVLSPWICFIVIAMCFFSGIRSRKSRAQDAQRP